MSSISFSKSLPLSVDLDMQTTDTDHLGTKSCSQNCLDFDSDLFFSTKGLHISEENIQNMARKKQTQRKVRVHGTVDTLEKSETLHESKVHQDGQGKSDQANDVESNILVPKGEHLTSPDDVESLSKEKLSVADNLVKVKEERTPLEPRTCSANESSKKQPVVSVQHVKVKEEPSSLAGTSSVAFLGNSCATTGAAMDLGSHLQQSLHAPPSTTLTWSQLMEPKNLPSMPSATRAVVKKELVEPTTEKPISQTYSTPLGGDAGNLRTHETRTTQGDGNGNMIDLFSFPKANRASPPISLSRFSSHLSESTGKARASPSEVGGRGTGNILDLSQRSLPPEIRRVLASKYGISKKVKESHSSTMIPNFSKSRSRFTVGPRKSAAGFQGITSDKKEEVESSPPPSMVLWREDQTDSGDPSMVPSQAAMEPRQTIPKIKLSEEVDPRALVFESRDSSGSPSSQCPPDDQPMKDVASDHLKNQGLLDLGSHYGELLRESSPKLTTRSSSRSPCVDDSASTGSPAAPPASEAMIELGQGRSEHIIPGNRRGEEAMIDLSSMENPPHSPSFRTVTFPSQTNYRPNFLPGHLPSHTYKPGRINSRPLRRNSSPGLSTRPSVGLPLDRSSSPQVRTPSGVLGSLGKSSEFGGIASSRDSEQVSHPLRVPSGGENRAQKRVHSVSSEEDGVKRPCTEGTSKDMSKVANRESDVKVNIGDLLKLEQEEQKYIQDLTGVQAQLAGVRSKMQNLQQELRTLQCSETDIKCRIDVVRSRRLVILKDAQDREGSRGTRETNAQGIRNKGDGHMRDVAVERQSGVFSGRRVTYDRKSPGFSTGDRDGYSGSLESKRKVELVDGVKEEDTGRDFQRTKTRSVEVLRDLSDSNQVLYAGHLSRNPHSAPSDLVLLSTHSFTENVASQARSDHSKGGDLARENVGKFEDLDESQKAFHEKVQGYVERYEIEDDCVGVENQDGMVLVQQGSRPRRDIQKGLSSVASVIHQVIDIDNTVKDLSDAGSKQFLGCLEISSTTEEPLTDDDAASKEILAEKERESLANKMSCKQERISSTVLSMDDVKQADTSVDSLFEMEFVGHSSAVCFVLPNKGKLFSASADRTAKAFDLKTGEWTTTFQGHQEAVNCLQITNEGGTKDRLFTGSNDQTVRAYNAKSGVCTHKFSFRGRVMCLHIAFGKLFVGLSSGFVAVIDLKTNKCIDQFNCHEASRISCLSSASEGQRSLLCTGSFDSTITIRDQSSGLLLRTITDHKLTVLCMQVVENILFSGSADTVVQSHDINTGHLVRSYTGHFMSVSGLQALGGVLVTSSLDRIIRCFDIKTGDLLQLYGGNSDMIFSLAVFNDMIYTGCRDGRLSGIKLDLRKYHCCKWSNCSLKFGLISHLKQHVRDHINQTIAFDGCLWANCLHKFPRGKQLDVIQAAMEHIIRHVSEDET